MLILLFPDWLEKIDCLANRYYERLYSILRAVQNENKAILLKTVKFSLFLIFLFRKASTFSSREESWFEVDQAEFVRVTFERC